MTESEMIAKFLADKGATQCNAATPKSNHEFKSDFGGIGDNARIHNKKQQIDESEMQYVFDGYDSQGRGVYVSIYRDSGDIAARPY